MCSGTREPPDTVRYLDCPYHEKDRAKGLGARWSPAQKKWYIDAEQDPAPFARWLGRSSSSSSSAPAPSTAATATASSAARPRPRPAPGPAASAPMASLCLYTDGACKHNEYARVIAVPAGWGVAVARDGEPVSELWGPVVLDASSPFFLGADCGSNNTAELTAVCEALLWLLEQEPREPATLCYDSKYAAMIASGEWKAKANVVLAARARELWSAASAERTLTLRHVKGHSGDRLNDLADALANRGLLSVCASGRYSACGAPRAVRAAAGSKRKLGDDDVPRM